MRPIPRSVPVVLFVLLAVTSVLAQSPVQPPDTAAAAPAPGGDTLPVRRVVLYKTGVGYFEHLGSVRNRQDVTVRFTSGQLNDVLKSLTTIDLGSGQITGITYNSIAPLDERLGALRLPIGSGATMVDLLTALRGARLEVASGTTTVAGRLLSVERQMRTQGGEPVTVDTVSILSDAGDVRSFELTPAVRVRIVDRDLRAEVGRYLDVVGSTREQDVRQMVISTAGTGDRPIFVSYISEVPIWKTTYRLVLRDGAKQPLLQGWAIVDNTIGEDWNDVELSLVAGAPQSFIQNISQPYYGRRPTVPMPAAAMMTPQTHQAAIRTREALAEADTGAPGSIGPVSRTREEVVARSQTQGFRTGIPGGTVGGVVGGVPAPPPPPAAPARVGGAAFEQIAAQASAADAGSLGDLFEYRIRQPVTIRKNQSALVPIVNAEIAAEKVVIWNRAPGSGRPLRAVWITNGSDLTLDGGSIAVIDGNAFAGEGLIEPLKPGERRLLSYAADPGILVDARQEQEPGRLVRVRARDGIVIQETEERATWTYQARSEDSEAATLVIEHAQRPGWTLAGGQSPEESTPQAHRFRVVVEPRNEATLVVREVRRGETRIALGDFSEAQLTHLLAPGASSEALQRALAPLLGKRSEVADVERRLEMLQEQQQTIVQDQERLRENMKALRGTSEERQLLQRYTRQLNDQENRLETLHAQIAETTRRRGALREELGAMIAGFRFEESQP
jgi:hypothetical protein